MNWTRFSNPTGRAVDLAGWGHVTMRSGEDETYVSPSRRFGLTGFVKRVGPGDWMATVEQRDLGHRASPEQAAPLVLRELDRIERLPPDKRWYIVLRDDVQGPFSTKHATWEAPLRRIGPGLYEKVNGSTYVGTEKALRAHGWDQTFEEKT